MNATERFSKTVDYYIRFRPGYPDELLSFLQNQLGVNANTAFADIGSGTGKLTELLVKNGSPVFAVEPNLEMREAAEVLLKDFSNFHSIDGTAENTRLPDQSVQIITAAQAFH